MSQDVEQQGHEQRGKQEPVIDYGDKCDHRNELEEKLENEENSINAMQPYPTGVRVKGLLKYRLTQDS